MAKKTVEDYKNELDDKINGKLRQRDKLMVELNKLGTELETLLEQKYMLEDDKTRIMCISCKGSGIEPQDDGTKKVCRYCGGKKYNWAQKYNEPETEE